MYYDDNYDPRDLGFKMPRLPSSRQTFQGFGPSQFSSAANPSQFPSPANVQGGGRFQMPAFPGAENAASAGRPGLQNWAPGMILPLGFATVQFAAGTALQFTVTSNPQRPVSPKIITVVATRTAGAVETVTISSIRIGAAEVLPTNDPLPIEMFGPAVQDGALDLLSAYVGTTISITYNCDANPAGADTITIATGIRCKVAS